MSGSTPTFCSHLNTFAQVGEEYDIIGFDPRGIGQTECVRLAVPRFMRLTAED